MRFNKLDLNLLVSLDALLTEANITRAAERLHLSQSATSNALARLRDYFGDPLLVQVGRRMELTPRADSLRGPVRDVLLRVDSTISTQPRFDPTQSDRCFRLFASDYTQMVLGPELMRIAQSRGSEVQMEFLPQVSNPHRELERGEADLLIIPDTYASPSHPGETLYEESFVCLVWRGSALAEGELTQARYAQARHVVMVPGHRPDVEAYEACLLRQVGVQRHRAVLTYSFGAMPALVAGTDCIATVHSRLAQRLCRAWPLVVKPLPFEVAAMPQTVQWHSYRSQDPGLIWLLGVCREAALAMDQHHSALMLS